MTRMEIALSTFTPYRDSTGHGLQRISKEKCFSLSYLQLYSKLHYREIPNNLQQSVCSTSFTGNYMLIEGIALSSFIPYMGLIVQGSQRISERMSLLLVTYSFYSSMSLTVYTTLRSHILRTFAMFYNIHSPGLNFMSRRYIINEQPLMDCTEQISVSVTLQSHNVHSISWQHHLLLPYMTKFVCRFLLLRHIC